MRQRTLADTGNIFDQNMATGEKSHKTKLYDVALALDDFFNIGLESGEFLGDRRGGNLFGLQLDFVTHFHWITFSMLFKNASFSDGEPTLTRKQFLSPS